MIKLINVPLQTTSKYLINKNIYISPSSLCSNPKTGRQRRVIILIILRVTSNPKSTEEETVVAVWNNGAIGKGGRLHINETDREAILAEVQVLWRKEEQNEQLDIFIL